MKWPLARIAYARFVCAFALAFALAYVAHAVIYQRVHTGYWTDPNGMGFPVEERSDFFYAPPSTPRDIVAQISGTGYQAISAAGIYGNLGMQGSHSDAGFLQADVIIRNSWIANEFVLPQRARAHFVIDGGFMHFLAGPVANLEFKLLLDAEIFDSQQNNVASSTWESDARLHCENFQPPQLLLNGQDIGIHMTDPFRADIPFSFQTFEIGVVPGGGRIDLIYTAIFKSSAPSIEFSEFQYSDPLNVSGEGEFPTVEFVPVPEPGAFIPLSVAFWIISLRCKRRMART